MHAVIETLDFMRDAVDAGLSDDEVRTIVTTISNNPEIGAVMTGTGGARKIRFGGRGKGKSGGYRVVTYYGGHDIPVFLLGVFSKGERDNLSKAERNDLRKELAGLATDYRASVRNRVADFKRRAR
jgi:hypothetical protein